MASIGDRIKLVRTAKKMSQAKLGKLAGIDQSVISDLENNPNSTSKKLVAIARALGVRAEWLENGTGDMHSTPAVASNDGWVMTKSYNLNPVEIRAIDVYREAEDFYRGAIDSAIDAAEADNLSRRAGFIINNKE